MAVAFNGANAQQLIVCHTNMKHSHQLANALIFLVLFFYMLITIRDLSADNNDAALRASLVWLAAVIVVVGIWTQSLNEVMVTCIVGVIGIAGILLPDWDYFDRDFSRWSSPITEEEKAVRNRISPLRLIAYSCVYGYAKYKWWTYISN